MKLGRMKKSGAPGDSFVHSTAISDVVVYKINDSIQQSASGTYPILSESQSFIDTKLQ